MYSCSRCRENASVNHNEICFLGSFKLFYVFLRRLLTNIDVRFRIHYIGVFWRHRFQCRILRILIDLEFDASLFHIGGTTVTSSVTTTMVRRIRTF